MNALIQIENQQGLIFRNIQRRRKVCNCILHRGMTLTQVEAELPNGEPIIVLETDDGYPVLIGECGETVNDLRKRTPPFPISEEELERMILEALQ